MQNMRHSVVWMVFGIGLCVFGLGLFVQGQFGAAKAQELKRYQYKIVDVLSDTQTMQAALNQYGSDGWELVAVGMGDLTAPRLIFKK